MKTMLAATAVCAALAAPALAGGWDTGKDPMAEFAASLEAQKQARMDEDAAAIRAHRAAAARADEEHARDREGRVRDLAGVIEARLAAAPPERAADALRCAERRGAVGSFVAGWGVAVGSDGAVRCAGRSGSADILSAAEMSDSVFEVVTTPEGASYLVDKTRTSAVGAGSDLADVAYTADEISDAVKAVADKREAQAKAGEPQSETGNGFVDGWNTFERGARAGDPLR
jgi:hypothetical protein